MTTQFNFRQIGKATITVLAVTLLLTSIVYVIKSPTEAAVKSPSEILADSIRSNALQQSEQSKIYNDAQAAAEKAKGEIAALQKIVSDQETRRDGAAVTAASLRNTQSELQQQLNALVSGKTGEIPRASDGAVDAGTSGKPQPTE